MRFSLQDYPSLANLLLIPVHLGLAGLLPGMGLAQTLNTPQATLFMALVWTGLVLEFPAISAHWQMARSRGVTGGFSRLIWVLLIFRIILLLTLGLLALEAVGLGMQHWAGQIFVPVYGIVYVLFCFFLAQDRRPQPPDLPVRRLAIGMFAAFWNLALITSLWHVVEGALMEGEPLPGARLVVIGLMSLLSLMIYVPARLPYLLLDQAGIGQGMRRAGWYAVFFANIIVPVAATYLR